MINLPHFVVLEDLALMMEYKNQENFDKIVEAFKKADTIAFNSVITNEEAFILQTLKEKYNFKLINPDAKAYQSFASSFKSASGEHFYSSNLNDLSDSDLIITVGSRLFSDNLAVCNVLTKAFEMNQAYICYMHPIEESNLQNIVQNFIKYEVGSEEGVLALLALTFIDNGSDELNDYLEDLDIGYLSAESNVGEEEMSFLKEKSLTAKKTTLVLGEDLFNHNNAKNIAVLAGLIERYTDFKILIVPSQTNTLGVSQICDLDEQPGTNVIGYNTAGNFRLTALGATNNISELNIPALNQQQGTITNLDKRVVVINPAVPYTGYSLNDIANELGLNKKSITEYTKLLPLDKGYKGIDFDELENEFTAANQENCGYPLSLDKEKYPLVTSDKVYDIDAIGEFNGTVIYRSNPVLQFNSVTNTTTQLSKESLLLGSSQFSRIAKVNDGDKVDIKFGENVITKMFKIDSSLKGTIGLLNTFDTDTSSSSVFSPYRFEKVNILSAGN